MTHLSEEMVHAQIAVLDILKGAHGKVLLKDLESSTHLDRKTLKKAIEELRSYGFEIDGKAGFSLSKSPDTIVVPVLLSGLKSKIIGKNVYSYNSIGSTNEAARRLAESGAPEGTIVITDRQTRGRGRLGRSWHSPPGMALFFSIILRPRIPFDRAPGLSLVSALSICRVVEKIAGVEPKIKWPNDCLIDNRKLAGILIEISAELDNIDYAVMGVGININNRKRDFPMSLRSKAISLAIATGKDYNRVEILKEFLYEFEKDYQNFTRYGLRSMGPTLVERSSVLGKEITVKFGKQRITGTVIGFDENGALRLKNKEGVKIISAGEVSLR